MYEMKTPCGKIISIPNDVSEDNKYFTEVSLTDAVQYYIEYGYVVIRSAVNQDLLTKCNKYFDEEIIPYQGYIYRQTGGNPEKNKFNSQNHVMNPILNIQDLPSKNIVQFKEAGLNIITSAIFQKFSQALWGKAPVLVQSMYFHGNSQTWAHQDSYYLDSSNYGQMFAGWVAAEDIHPGAGRFFIYPKSHKHGLMKNTGALSVAGGHAEYKKKIIEWVDNNGLECRAPALKKGDVLIWNANTVHGSLGSNVMNETRRSLTCHFIPDGDSFMQFHSRKIKLKLREANGIKYHSPKPLDSLKRKSILLIETTFPKTFQKMKWAAVKFFTK